MKIEALIIGNITNSEAEELVSSILQVTKSKPLLKEQEVPIEHLVLETGSTLDSAFVRVFMFRQALWLPAHCLA